MENQSVQTTKDYRKDERGAALVTVLMISFLLLVAIVGLLLEASTNSSNVTDATAETQAYYAAESGIQDTINVLRGNSPYQISTGDKIDYFKASKLCKSNISCNCSTSVCSSTLDNELRLSRWLNYDTTYPDRVVLGASTVAGQPAYTPETGFAYKVRIENPDNIGNSIVFNTSGTINGLISMTWGGLTIKYDSVVSRTLDVTSGQAATDFGKFVVSGTGMVPTRTRFAIKVNLTTPYVATKIIRGYIEPGTVNINSSTIKILYDSQAFVVAGSVITLSPPPPTPPNTGTNVPATRLADGVTYRVGYEVTPNAPNVNSGETSIVGTITSPEPIRLIIHSTGFAPHGAKKELEAVIQKNYFNGLSAPSPLTLIGPNATVTPLTNFVFNPGTSDKTSYDGKDKLLTAFLPPIGLTDDLNVAATLAGVEPTPPHSFKGSVYGTISNVREELPFWLQSPKNLDATLQQLKEVAKASGRYFKTGDVYPKYGEPNYGNFANATGITYIDGDLEFAQEGGGILVVTGTLTFRGGFKFNGLVVVTGKGGILRDGGGGGSLQGNMVVAPYNAAGVSCIANDVTCFLAPTYDISGGGNSEIAYNSNNVANGLSALSNFVKGVAEK